MECLLRVGLLALLCSCATGVSQPSLSGTFLPGTSILYLGCNTPSRNSSALSWFKEDPIDYSLSLFTSNPDLEFQSVAASDAACYYCYLEGDVVDFVCLDVPAQQSGVVELSYTGVFVEGSTFEYFGCSKGGRDASNVQWYAVNPGSNQTFHSQFTLAFTSLAPGDTGYYHCMYNGELVDKVFINVTQAAVPECTGDNTGQVDKVTEAPPKALTRDEIIFIAIGAVLFVLMLLLFIWAVCWCCACVQMKRATGKNMCCPCWMTSVIIPVEENAPPVTPAPPIPTISQAEKGDAPPLPSKVKKHKKKQRVSDITAATAEADSHKKHRQKKKSKKHGKDTTHTVVIS
ncbi:uncharacterized protein LOC106173931 [Lingula anatina]|uniref:Uncharacterized protein LOC106173931 n=1 Tax=Lingula anatina TaxID=7574 RepID=A0A1S3JJY5_LINAN|nr:uncharacterized protein LOC106173931 [Lingula anatina]|eukprot:XP_013410725.1 uncharacterized protein LOC106173931 [Lingula anatina]